MTTLCVLGCNSRDIKDMACQIGVKFGKRNIFKKILVKIQSKTFRIYPLLGSHFEHIQYCNVYLMKVKHSQVLNQGMSSDPIKAKKNIFKVTKFLFLSQLEMIEKSIIQSPNGHSGFSRQGNLTHFCQFI